MRAVIVGASSGLGRSIAAGLAMRDVELVLMGRRMDRLNDAVQAIDGDRAHAVACDVTDEDSCHYAVGRALDLLGGVDALIYAAGIGKVQRLRSTSQQSWRDSLDTNVVGAALVTAAAIDALEASGGNALYLSSVSASLTPPWPGLGAYAVSKAALDKLVEAWRAEHPRVGFTRVVVGDCAGGEGASATEFASGWDQDLAGQLAPDWFARGYMNGALIDVAALVELVAGVLAVGPSASVPSVVLTPRTNH